MLLREILNIQDENVREFIVLAFSSIVETNNDLCRNNELRQTTEGVFSRHAFWPTSTFGEGNVWGSKFGRGTFAGYFSKMRRGKQYAIRPFERN